jgi:outer membrane lipoprotein SlyB
MIRPATTLTLPLVALLAPLVLAGCARDFSPNTYGTQAVQQANKVNQGVVIGVRKVDIKGDSATGAATGAAAGGIIGSNVGKGTASALSTLAGTVSGGLIGATAEQAAENTWGYEYIVKRGNGDLLSVTQHDEKPLAIGTKVLLIEGAQARIVPDYTVQLEEPKKEEPKAEEKKPEEKPAEKPAPVTTEPLPPPPATSDAKPTEQPPTQLPTGS